MSQSMLSVPGRTRRRADTTIGLAGPRVVLAGLTHQLLDLVQSLAERPTSTLPMARRNSGPMASSTDFPSLLRKYGRPQRRTGSDVPWANLSRSSISAATIAQLPQPHEAGRPPDDPTLDYQDCARLNDPRGAFQAQVIRIFGPCGMLEDGAIARSMAPVLPAHQSAAAVPDDSSCRSFRSSSMSRLRHAA